MLQSGYLKLLQSKPSLGERASPGEDPEARSSGRAPKAGASAHHSEEEDGEVDHRSWTFGPDTVRKLSIKLTAAEKIRARQEAADATRQALDREHEKISIQF